MKVFISADIEGITGIVDNVRQTSDQARDYERARRLMTGDVNAAIAGAYEAGATEVLVADGHGAGLFRNIILEDLDPRCEFVAGFPRPLVQVEGIDSSYGIALFVGYHARMGSDGVRSHTISGTQVQNVWVNDVVMGETGLNAAIAGHYGVPVGLVTGDQCLAHEAQELMPWVDACVVKQALSRNSARFIPPLRSQAMIRSAACEAVKRAGAGQYKPLKISSPMTYKIQFLNSGMADGAARYQGATRINPTTFAVQVDDPVSGYLHITGLIGLATT